MSIVVSLLLVVFRTAFPRITTLGRLPGTEIFRSIKMYPHAETAPGLLLLRIDAPIYFANVEGVKEFVRERVIASKKSRAERGDCIRFVIIDFSPVTDIDSTACHFIDDVRLRDCHAAPPGSVVAVLADWQELSCRSARSHLLASPVHPHPRRRRCRCAVC